MARDMPGPPVSSSPDRGRPDVEGQGADLAGTGQPAPKPEKPRKQGFVNVLTTPRPEGRGFQPSRDGVPVSWPTAGGVSRAV